jgi:hypothetical protein
VIAGEWSQKELFDGTYDFHDLIEIHEFLDVIEENRARRRAAAERK